ncbi:hypothetical protein [Armatimonas sp.]|uniref:hypothetical protein n=1 Tax=Armatimonas sp. TaxID=1872638 RepID=UPI00286A274B|nr:hypothetical protein [Armatimonas sp.]
MDVAKSYLYFTGQFYRRSTTKQATLDALGPYRLWRIRPDGTGLKALTDSKQDTLMTPLGTDRNGVYLEYGKRFRRGSVLHHLSLRNGTLKRCAELQEFSVGHFSPNGRFVVNTRNLYDRQTGKTKKFPEEIIDSAWSLDSKRLYLLDYASRVTILELATGKEAPAPVLYNCTWLSDGTLVGDSQQDFQGQFPFLRICPGSANPEKLMLKPLKEQDWRAGLTYRRCWHPIPGKPDCLLAETMGSRSDGEHYTCVFVDLKRRTWKPLSQGRLVGISPDGKQIATAEEEWIGEYKRGGQRCGALEIITLATGRRRAITTNLVSITGGFWQ